MTSQSAFIRGLEDEGLVVKMMQTASPALVLSRLAVLASLGFVSFMTYKLFQMRLRMRRIKKMGLPMMPHSFLFGHLPMIIKVTKSLPQDIYPNYMPETISNNWQEFFPEESKRPNLIYVDLWPLGPQLLFITKPEHVSQITDVSNPRSTQLVEFFRPMTGNIDMVSSDGHIWKTWRGRFNPGFSQKNLVKMIPFLIDAVGTFSDILKAKANEKPGVWGHEVISLQDLATNLTFDVITRAALNLKLDEQLHGPTILKTAFFKQMEILLVKYNPMTVWMKLSPWRLWGLWRNNRDLRKILMPAIQRSLDASKEGAQATASFDDSESGGYKTLVDLALAAYKEEQKEALASGGEELPPPDDAFIEIVLSQLKVFLFAGHDTTSVVLCWVLWCTQKYPEAAEKMRAEHDAVLGNPEEAKVRLRENPQLLGQLPYTSAFIKEVFRVQPGVPIMRQGRPGHFLFDPETSLQYPTEGVTIWDSHMTSRFWEELWHRPNEFLPERFMTTDPEDPLYPQKNAWKTFSFGPRNCIGQELALMEVKLASVLLVREIDVTPAYEQWDAMVGRKGKPEHIGGERAYQIGPGTPHIKDAMPVQVRRRPIQA